MKKKITLKLILSNIDAIITALTLTACVILVNLNVLMRYIANAPLYWCEEVVTMLFVWTVFIGSTYAYRKHAHLGVDILVNKLPPKTKRVVSNIIAVLELLVLIMLTVISAQYVYHLLYSRAGVYKPALSDVLRMPKWWSGIAVPIGFGSSTIFSIYFLLTERFHVIKKKIKIDDIVEHEVEEGNF